MASSILYGVGPQADAQSIGYREPANISTLPKASVSPGGDVESKIRQIIRDNRNGVVITFKRGTYTVNKAIKTASDVHLRFESGVNINQGSTQIVFSLPKDATNTSIRGPVKINAKTGANKFKAVSAEASNFLVSRLSIDNKFTPISSMSTARGAKNGTIENIESDNNPPGYGTYQIRAGENILIRNLDGVGGFTFRLEQAAEAGPNAGQGEIKNVRVENVKCTNGRAAVLVAPGERGSNLSIDGVTSEGCQWAVAAGSAKRNGSFSNIKMSNIVAKYGDGQSAQFRTRSKGNVNSRFIPDGLQNKVRNLAEREGGRSGKFQEGPASGVVFLNGDIRIDFAGGNPSRQGFPSAYSNDPVIVKVADIKRIGDSR